MNYAEADAKLTGRCRYSRKLENNTYLERQEGSDAIRLRLHSTDILTFYKSGIIVVNTGGWNTVTTRARLNAYLPRPWGVHAERGATILNGNDISPSVVLSNHATIQPNGKIKGGADVKSFRARIREQDNETSRENARLRYWIRKARGLVYDASACTKKSEWCSCHPRRGWGRRTGRPLVAWECSNCGCCVRRGQMPVTTLTVSDVMAEKNSSVRVAKIHAFGFERFFIESKAETLDTHGDYALLHLGAREPDAWMRPMRALKMVCPSTGVVYISPVDPSCSTVPQALDWMFDTENYLGQVVQQA